MSTQRGRDLQGRAEVGGVVGVVVVVVSDPFAHLPRQPLLGLLSQLDRAESREWAAEGLKPPPGGSATLTQTDGLRLSWDSVSGGKWKSAGSVVFLVVALRADLLLVVAACHNGDEATPLSDTSCLKPLPPEAIAHPSRPEVRVKVDVLFEVDLEGLLGFPLPWLLVGQVVHCGHKGAALYWHPASDWR